MSAVLKKRSTLLACLWLFCLFPNFALAAIIVTDDAGNIITLQAPAKRIISLSPHVTELIFAAGAGDKIVGTVNYSDYPAAAKAIPRLGDNRQLDIERIIAMKPDLLVVWMHGAFERQLEPLRQSGIPYFFSEPHTLENIPETLIKLGTLLGTEKIAGTAAQEFRQELAQLSSRYQTKSTVRTFYQVWGKPIFTLNDKNIVSDVIRTCGGENIFGRLAADAPSVSTEAVLKENPELIISGDSKNQAQSGILQWKDYSNLLAVKNHNLLALDGDQLNRAGPRIIQGAKAVCLAMEAARNKRTIDSMSNRKVGEK
ncbi:cobalamin-binding protein [Undibacterium sp. Ren11W]|uniref:cobalamin-binding protein n=1 Tax=Undibacterium sp. Ren11W TaxID=3413045 RepID=UPI003BEF5B8B